MFVHKLSVDLQKTTADSVIFQRGAVVKKFKAPAGHARAVILYTPEIRKAPGTIPCKMQANAMQVHQVTERLPSVINENNNITLPYKIA